MKKTKPILLIIFFTFFCLPRITLASAALNDLWHNFAELDDPELVNFVGNPTAHPLDSEGRISLVDVGSNTIYGYFNNYKNSSSAEIYLGISTDGGKTFNVKPDPVIAAPYDIPNVGRLNTAYDPDVIKRPEGYYMVFEGGGDIHTDSQGCQFSSFIAFSANGVDNWQVKNVIACATGGWPDATKNIGNSASVPSFVEAASGDLYLQWVNVDFPTRTSTKHQLKINLADPFKTLTTDVAVNSFPMSVPGSWDRTWDTANTIYENGYYYMFYMASPIFQPVVEKGRFGIGLARTVTVDNISSWQKYNDNPLILSPSDTTCWIQYPDIIKINGDYYLYYFDGIPFWQPTYHNKVIFRSKIIPKRTGNFAGFVSQSVPVNMTAGQSYSASVSMENTGSTSWSEADLYRLGSQNPQDGKIWNNGRIYFSSSQTADPYYCSDAAFVESLGGGVKSQPSMRFMNQRLIIAVQGADDSVWIKEWMPYYKRTTADWYIVNGGKTESRPLLVQEHGTLWLYAVGLDGNTYRTWYKADNIWAAWENIGVVPLSRFTNIANGYKVWKQSDNSIALGKCEATSEYHKFDFTVTAPSTPGTYNFQWQMVQDGVEWFGEKTPNVSINVIAACVPKTCPSLGYSCGTAGDGCGNTLNCGTCNTNQTCTANKCVLTCIPTCSTANAKQCNGNGVQTCTLTAGCLKWSTAISCGTGKTCNSGVCQTSCVPKTCATLGSYECGSWSDGCGKTINCGTCVSGKTCSNGKCVTDCTSHSTQKCDDGNLYWYNSCDTKEEISQNCGTNAITSNYQCFGTWIQRETITKGCSDNACTSGSNWSNIEDCFASGKTCSNGTCVFGSGSGGGGGSGSGSGSSSISGSTTTTKMTRVQIIAKINEIAALIAKLKERLTAITGKTTTSTYSCTQITKVLRYGMKNDSQVKCLQEVLKAQGFAVVPTGDYGGITRTAVKLFQEKYASEILVPYGLKYGSGNVGNGTMAKINSLIVK